MPRVEALSESLAVCVVVDPQLKTGSLPQDRCLSSNSDILEIAYSPQAILFFMDRVNFDSTIEPIVILKVMSSMQALSEM